MAEWEKVRIGNFLTRVKYPLALEVDVEYQLVTVKMHHKGVVPREQKLGKQIGSKMYQVNCTLST